jgi:hypothetical protein
LVCVLIVKKKRKNKMSDRVGDLWETLQLDGLVLDNDGSALFDMINRYIESADDVERKQFVAKTSRDYRIESENAKRMVAASPRLTAKFGGMFSIETHPSIMASAGLREIFASPPRGVSPARRPQTTAPEKAENTQIVSQPGLVSKVGDLSLSLFTAVAAHVFVKYLAIKFGATWPDWIQQLWYEGAPAPGSFLGGALTKEYIIKKLADAYVKKNQDGEVFATLYRQLFPSVGVFVHTEAPPRLPSTSTLFEVSLEDRKVFGNNARFFSVDTTHDFWKWTPPPPPTPPSSKTDLTGRTRLFWQEAPYSEQIRDMMTTPEVWGGFLQTMVNGMVTGFFFAIASRLLIPTSLKESKATIALFSLLTLVYLGFSSYAVLFGDNPIPVLIELLLGGLFHRGGATLGAFAADTSIDGVAWTYARIKGAPEIVVQFFGQGNDERTESFKGIVEVSDFVEQVTWRVQELYSYMPLTSIEKRPRIVFDVGIHPYYDDNLEDKVDISTLRTNKTIRVTFVDEKGDRIAFKGNELSLERNLLREAVAERFEKNVNDVTAEMEKLYQKEQAQERAVERADARRQRLKAQSAKNEERKQSEHRWKVEKKKLEAIQQKIDIGKINKDRMQLQYEQEKRGFQGPAALPAPKVGAAPKAAAVPKVGGGNRRRGQSPAGRGRAAAAALSAVGSGPDEIEAAARLLLSSGMFF